MKLLTEALKKRIPKLYTQAEKADPLCVCKFFSPDSQWTWLVIEGDEQDDGDWMFFGYVMGLDNELGYFTLSQLKSVRGLFGLPVERDRFFKPTRLSKCMERVRI